MTLPPRSCVEGLDEYAADLMTAANIAAASGVAYVPLAKRLDTLRERLSALSTPALPGESREDSRKIGYGVMICRGHYHVQCNGDELGLPGNPFKTIDAAHVALRDYLVDLFPLSAPASSERAPNWQEEARRYAANADYWRTRVEQALEEAAKVADVVARKERAAGAYGGVAEYIATTIRALATPKETNDG